MDAIASLVFAILVIEFVMEDGATEPAAITKEVFKAGLIAVGCLAFVYIFIAKIGADSVAAFGIQETGAPVLSKSAMILLAMSARSSWLSSYSWPACRPLSA